MQQAKKNQKIGVKPCGEVDASHASSVLAKNVQEVIARG
jgi:hypothetical protein